MTSKKLSNIHFGTSSFFLCQGVLFLGGGIGYNFCHGAICEFNTRIHYDYQGYITDAYETQNGEHKYIKKMEKQE